MLNKYLDRKAYKLSAQSFETKGLWDYSFVLNKTCNQLYIKASLIDPLVSREKERNIEKQIKEILERHRELFEALED
jgi:hypothetical protein